MLSGSIIFNNYSLYEAIADEFKCGSLATPLPCLVAITIKTTAVSQVSNFPFPVRISSCNTFQKTVMQLLKLQGKERYSPTISCNKLLESEHLDVSAMLPIVQQLCNLISDCLVCTKQATQLTSDFSVDIFLAIATKCQRV